MKHPASGRTITRNVTLQSALPDFFFEKLLTLMTRCVILFYDATRHKHLSKNHNNLMWIRQEK